MRGQMCYSLGLLSSKEEAMHTNCGQVDSELQLAIATSCRSVRKCLLVEFHSDSGVDSVYLLLSWYLSFLWAQTISELPPD